MDPFVSTGKLVKKFASKIPFSFIYGIVLLFVIASGIIFSGWFYSAYYANHEQGELSMDQNENILIYVQGNANFLLPVGKTVFSEKEISHMKDVQVLYLLMKKVAATLAIILLICIFNVKDLQKSLRFAAKINLVSITLSVIAVTLFFKPLFILFHRLSFSNSDWLLPHDSLLIQLYPNNFFITITLTILICTILAHSLVLWTTNK